MSDIQKLNAAAPAGATCSWKSTRYSVWGCLKMTSLWSADATRSTRVGRVAGLGYGHVGEKRCFIRVVERDAGKRRFRLLVFAGTMQIWILYSARNRHDAVYKNINNMVT